MRDMSRVAARLNDDTLIDGQDLFYHIKPHHRTLHDLCLRSAYEQYSSGGESLLTTSHPAEGGYSVCNAKTSSFTPNIQCHRKVLALPDLSMLEGMNLKLCAEPILVILAVRSHGRLLRSWKAPEPMNGYGNTAAGRASIDTAKRELWEK